MAIKKPPVDNSTGVLFVLSLVYEHRLMSTSDIIISNRLSFMPFKIIFLSYVALAERRLNQPNIVSA